MQGDKGGGTKDYAAMFNRFFKSAKLASTYKPFLAAALVDVSEGGGGGRARQAWEKWTRREGDGMRVDLDLVAALVARHYWDVTAGMDPRHTPPRMASPDNPDEDIGIIGLIKEEAEKRKRMRACREIAGADVDAAGALGASRGRGRRSFAGDGPPTLEELASDEMAGFRKKVIKVIKREALVHLPTDMDLYEACDGGAAIALDAGAAAHMRRNAATIRTALGHMIARHLEDNNPSARHLATMVDLNAGYGARIKRVRKQEASAAPVRGDPDQPLVVSQDDISPLYTMSLDLAAGLAKLSRPRARGRR